MRRLLWILVFPIAPELSLTEEEKAKVWKRAQTIRYPGYGRKNLWRQIAGAFLGIALWFLLEWLYDWLNRSIGGFVALPILFLIFPAGLFLISVSINRPINRPRLYRALRECGYDICLHCGYWLKELPPDEIMQCPECGEERPPGSPESLPETNLKSKPDSTS